ncbi:MAG TPA: hypothetical protein VHG29_12500 [Novosphingobium sp.]|nr:hypothetical protein [Novosphingobium sp.]
MRIIWAKLAIAIAAVFTVAATPAMAQATRTWVSGVGDDVNPCSRTAPCKTFAGAISKTAAGGEINTLDDGAYGAVTITKSITLRSDSNEAGVLATLGSSGIIINAAATDKIIIDGLDIFGAGTGLNGIRVLSARVVAIRNTIIHGFLNGGTGNGILIASTTPVSLSVNDSFVSDNNVGVNVLNTAGTGRARVHNSAIIDNTNAGVRVTNAINSADISGNQIVRSTKSLDIVTGGVIRSSGDNVLDAGDAPTIVPKG